MIKNRTERIKSLEKELAELRQHENDCHITGSEITFDEWVPQDKIRERCQEIWDHPEKVSSYPAKSEDAYYRFLKFLWVEFPDGSQQRLDDLVTL